MSGFTVFFGVYQFQVQVAENRARDKVDSIRFTQQILDQRVQFEKQMTAAEVHFRQQFTMSKRTDSAQLKLTEQSIKNFVRPALVIRRYFDLEREELGLFIQNSGIGPAIITSIEIYYDKRKLNALRKSRVT